MTFSIEGDERSGAIRGRGGEKKKRGSSWKRVNLKAFCRSASLQKRRVPTRPPLLRVLLFLNDLL